MCGNTGSQMGGWFRKEINSPDDLKGLKMRIPGLGGDVMAKLGASTVSLPGGQIYENLIAGSIDATEWVGPWNDGFMKFYEAAKYYYYPGMHEPGSMLAIGMNKKWWDGLSKSDQLTIEAHHFSDFVGAGIKQNNPSRIRRGNIVFSRLDQRQSGMDRSVFGGHLTAGKTVRPHDHYGKRISGR